MLPTKFRSIWPSCIRVEDFQKLKNQKKELSVAAMFVNRLGQNENLYKRTQMLPTKFRIIWPYGFRGEDFQKQTNQKQESPVAAMLVNGIGTK